MPAKSSWLTLRFGFIIEPKSFGRTYQTQTESGNLAAPAPQKEKEKNGKKKKKEQKMGRLLETVSNI